MVRGVVRHLGKVKEVRWLVPGWVWYQYYKVHKDKGYKKHKALLKGAKAEALRVAVTASFPVPGSYELTTAGLAYVKNKIEKGDIYDFNIKDIKSVIPIMRKNKFAVRKPHKKNKIISVKEKAREKIQKYTGRIFIKNKKY